MARTISTSRSSRGPFSKSKKDITVKKSILKAKTPTIYPLKKTISKKKVYKKTPLKSQTNDLIIHSKRPTKKTERAIESAEQAKLFQTLKLKAPETKKEKEQPKIKKAERKKKVSFNLKHHIIEKEKKAPKKTTIEKKQKPLQGIIKQNGFEDRVTELEKKVKEIFQILKSKNLK